MSTIRSILAEPISRVSRPRTSVKIRRRLDAVRVPSLSEIRPQDVQRMVRKRNWELLGRWFNFTPHYFTQSDLSKVIDWNSVPHELCVLLMEPKCKKPRER